jgi:flagellar protein FliS
MNQQAAQNYLRTKVLTATPEQLQMMLYDGALRFAEQARGALQQRNFEQSYNLISRVQKIIMELSSSLKHDISPELCRRLSALYTYIYTRLIEANTQHGLEPLDEAIALLKYQRDTWTMLMHQLGKTRAAAAARTMEMPSPDNRMEEVLRRTA